MFSVGVLPAGPTAAPDAPPASDKAQRFPIPSLFSPDSFASKLASRATWQISHLDSDDRSLSAMSGPSRGWGAIEGAGATGNAKQRGAPLVQSLERDQCSYV